MINKQRPPGIWKGLWEALKEGPKRTLLACGRLCILFLAFLGFMDVVCYYDFEQYSFGSLIIGAFILWGLSEIIKLINWVIKGFKEDSINKES